MIYSRIQHSPTQQTSIQRRKIVKAVWLTILSILSILPLNSVQALSTDQISQLTTSVRTLCELEKPTQDGESLLVEGEAEGNVILRLVNAKLRGKVNKEKWEGRTQFPTTQAERVKCAQEMMALLLPAMSSSNNEPAAAPINTPAAKPSAATTPKVPNCGASKYWDDEKRKCSNICDASERWNGEYCTSRCAGNEKWNKRSESCEAQGLQSGEYTMQCGCWGYVNLGVVDRVAECASGFGQTVGCDYLCPTGGYQWTIQCQ